MTPMRLSRSTLVVAWSRQQGQMHHEVSPSGFKASKETRYVRRCAYAIRFGRSLAGVSAQIEDMGDVQISGGPCAEPYPRVDQWSVH